MNSYNIIASFLSSSEINRCKKNGLQWYAPQTVQQWNDIFKQSWLPRKLRRKLRHLYDCDILPVEKVDYVIGVGIENPELFKAISDGMMKHYLDVEDEAILKGIK